MADYSKFDRGLARWLKDVWAKRRKIKNGVNDEGRTEGAWLIYDLYNDPNIQKEDTKKWRTFQKAVKSLSKQYGVPVQPQGDEWKASEFYHFGPDRLPDGSGNWRVYCHIKSPQHKNWSPPATYVLKRMQASDTRIAKFKIAGPQMSKKRHDSMVIWVNSEADALSLINDLKTRFADNFTGSPPPSVKQVATGLGWAKEPSEDHSSPGVDEVWGTDNHSFGSYLAGVILMALEQSWDLKEKDYVEEVRQFFLNVGINPMNPHQLRTMSWEDVKLLAGVANRRLSGTVIPSLAQSKDSTNVFPMQL
jgi:hypothetical protein